MVSIFVKDLVYMQWRQRKEKKTLTHIAKTETTIGLSKAFLFQLFFASCNSGRGTKIFCNGGVFVQFEKMKDQGFDTIGVGDGQNKGFEYFKQDFSLYC